MRLAIRYLIETMKTVEEIRLQRLKMLIDEYGSAANLSRAAQREPRDSTFSQILNGSSGSKSGKPKTMGSELARALELALAKPKGWMDNDPDASTQEWPFSLPFERFDALPADMKAKVEGLVEGMVIYYESQRADPGLLEDILTASGLSETGGPKPPSIHDAAAKEK